MQVNLPNVHINQVANVCVAIGDEITCVIWDFAHINGIVKTITNTSLTVENARAYNFLTQNEAKKYEGRNNLTFTFSFDDFHSLKVHQKAQKAIQK